MQATGQHLSLLRLTRREHVTLGVLGTACLVLLGGLWWQQRRPPLTIVGSPSARQAAEWDRLLDAARRINVNTATAAELERLPQIGSVLAQRMIDDRTRRGAFSDSQQLQRVEGIGSKTYEAIRDYVSVED